MEYRVASVTSFSARGGRRLRDSASCFGVYGDAGSRKPDVSRHDVIEIEFTHATATLRVSELSLSATEQQHNAGRRHTWERVTT